MLEFAMRAQVIASGVGRPAEWTFEAARKVHMVMVAYVGDHFAAKLAPMQIATA